MSVSEPHTGIKDSGEDSDSDFIKTPPRKRKRKKRRKTRWWNIKASKLKRDERFEDKDLGDGVFTTRRIKVRIYFEGGIHQCKTSMTKRQLDYGVQSDYPNYCWTPTDKDIEDGKLHRSWKINHTVKEPTHELLWDEATYKYPYGRPYLEPLMTLEKETELSYDYNNK